ncbi:MAG: site-specific DNA-methyltransferase [Treponema sp.]|jgi:site-specific DNA-methyltransferase (adenine-specific)|nr:site-specific DNA-methyltransferase [Treponema sp.]
MAINPDLFYNDDCISGAQKYLKNDSIDLMITDPPYGIAGNTLHKHYHRDESNVIDGYVEIPSAEYPAFSQKWIREAERVLRPGGSIYIVSGWTHLRHILNALADTKLKEVNHIIWKYNFGVYTSQKYISSHYHILYYVKPGGKKTFNTFAFFSDSEKTENGGSANYLDREDVWILNCEYKPGQIKNKNELPQKLLQNLILYSSNPGDMICDFFLGSFSTAKCAFALGRNACGFEINKQAFDYQMSQLAHISFGSDLSELRIPPKSKVMNRGKALAAEEITAIVKHYNHCLGQGCTKRQSVEKTAGLVGRGYWSVLNVIEKRSQNENSPQHRGLGLFGRGGDTGGY